MQNKSVLQTLAQALGVSAAGKRRLYQDIEEAADLRCWGYWLDLTFAAGIATLGLVLNSPVVVIGAMLISPLMGPILSLGLAFASADLRLGWRSLLCVGGSILASVLFSASAVWLLPFHLPTAEILARTSPNLLDLAVAIISGLAGSVVMARSAGSIARSEEQGDGGPTTGGKGDQGKSGALPGVAIAVSLMPPLCTVGFGVGSGWNWAIISGAGLLFLTNLVAIATAAFLVFYLLGMGEAEEQPAWQPARLAGRGAPLGQLRWRLLMVAVTMGMLFFPLRASLFRLRDETVGRAAAKEAVARLVPAEHLVNQQIEFLPERTILRVVTTASIAEPERRQMEADLQQRTGKAASVQIRHVAHEEELLRLQERFARAQPMPEVAAQPDLGKVAMELAPMVDQALYQVWPAEGLRLEGSEVVFRDGAPGLRLRYRAARRLDGVAQEAIEKALRLQLRSSELAVFWEHAGPLRPTLQAAGPGPNGRARQAR